MENKLDLSVFTDFYKGVYPKSVVGYVKSYPAGYSRTVLKSKFGITVTELLKMLVPTHEKSNVSWSMEKLNTLLTALNLQLSGDFPEKLTARSEFTVKCCSCSFERMTYIDSLRNQIVGCPNCAGCAKLSTRKSEMDAVAISKGVDIVRYPTNNKDTVNLKCLGCRSEYRISLMQFWYRGEGYGICPTCHPTHSRRFLEDGYTFPSMVELSSYRLIRKYFTSFRLQVPYKEFVHTNRKFVADFQLPCGTIIEVGGMANNEEYHSRIREKTELCYLNKVPFFYFYRVEELQDFLLERYSPL